MKDEKGKKPSEMIVHVPQQPIVDFSDVLRPYQESISSLVKSINTAHIFSQTVVQQSKQLQIAIIDLQKPAQQMAEALKSVSDSRLMIQQIFSEVNYPVQLLKNAFIDLSTLHSFAKLTAHASLTLELKTVRKTQSNQYALHSTATEEITHKQVSLTSSAEINVVAEVKQIKGQTADLNIRMAQIEAMITTNSGLLIPAQIKEFGFDGHNSILTIKGIRAKLRLNSKQAAICHCLLNQENIKERVLIDDIVEAFGEHPTLDNMARFKDLFRFALIHLNKKINEIYEMPDFIQHSQGYYWINGIYLKLFV